MKQETTEQNIVRIEPERALPPSVDFMLLGRCNLNCDFCFGPQHEIPPMETGFAIGIINKLADNGVEQVVFTGGEPTLITDLPIIIQAAKDRNLTTVLSTNGIMLERDEDLLDKIAPNLDWIALPLEADTAEVNASMRTGFTKDAGIRQFDAVLKLIPQIRERYPSLGIKLGTVVSMRNSESIVGIPNMLSAYGAIPDTWKLYQISPSEYGKVNYERLKIDDEQFERLYSEASRRAAELGFPNITKYTNNERPGKYLFINPLGDALVVHPDTNDYYRIGNMLSGFDSASRAWKDYVKTDLLSQNFQATYPQLEKK